MRHLPEEQSEYLIVEDGAHRRYPHVEVVLTDTVEGLIKFTTVKRACVLIL